MKEQRITFNPTLHGLQNVRVVTGRVPFEDTATALLS